MKKTNYFPQISLISQKEIKDNDREEEKFSLM